MRKRLYKSNTDKMVAGVCGGIAAYFDIDPTLVRLIWVLFCVAGGSGLLGYIIAAIIIPQDPGTVGQPTAIRINVKNVRRPPSGCLRTNIYSSRYFDIMVLNSSWAVGGV